MLYLALSFLLLFDKAMDIKVPPEFVKPWIKPTIERIEILKKLNLILILSFKSINEIEIIITKATNNLKFINSWKYFNINKPIIIDGTHTTKNLINPLWVLTFRFLSENLIIIKLIRLVRIDRGNRIKKTSIILYPSNNKKGVPKTNTPTPIDDWRATIKQK